MSGRPSFARRALAWGALAGTLLAASAAAPARAQTSGSISFFVSAAVPPSAPEPIAGLIASGTSTVDGEVYLEWFAPDAYTPPEGVAASQYTLKYATFSVGALGDNGVNNRGNTTLSGNTTSWWNAANYTLFLASAPLYPGTTTTLQLDRLTPGATLYFAMRSTNSVSAALSPIDVNAATNNQASVVVPDFPPPPLAQSGITATPVCGGVDMTWTGVSTSTIFDFNHYALWYSSTPPTYSDLTVAGTTQTAYNTPITLPTPFLSNFTTYYFQVREYNNSGYESTNNAVVSTVAYAVPPPAVVQPITGSTVTTSLFLQWANPIDPRFSGGMLVRTSPLPLNASPANNTVYVAQCATCTANATNSIGNGTIVLAWAAGANAQTTFSDVQLASGATYYYYVFNFYQQQVAASTVTCYSQPGSQSIILQPRPMAPANVNYFLDAQGFSHLSWDAVTYFNTGAKMCGTGSSPFQACVNGYPPATDLDGYNLYSSTCGAGGCSGVWNRLNSQIVAVSSTSAQIASPTPNVLTYYIVRAANNFEFESGNSNTVDSSAEQYTVGTRSDGTIFAVEAVPPSIKTALLAANNGISPPTDLVLVLTELTGNENGGVIRACALNVARGDTGVIVPNFTFKSNLASLTMSDLPLVGSVATASAKGRSVAKADNPNLDMFWYNGVRYMELFGNVNAAAEAVTVQTAQTGDFELQSANVSTTFSFNPALDLYPRILTPNGDGKNDIMFFITNVAGVTGKIFDIRGAKVATLSASVNGASCPANAGNCLMWDGKAGGTVVQSGVYIYDLEGNGTHYTGTVAVKR